MHEQRLATKVISNSSISGLEFVNVNLASQWSRNENGLSRGGSSNRGDSFKGGNSRGGRGRCRSSGRRMKQAWDS